ncbi:MAG: non-canonical purine NTP pyrophosphatase [Gemmatimonadales bacterium]
MVKLLVATRSAGKQREIRRLLADASVEVVFPDEVNAWETEAEKTLELHDSFQGNARAKAEYFVKQTRLPTVADDSGLEVFSLGGEPGVRSKRWAQVDGSTEVVDAANNALLLRRLAGASETRRRARYRCVLVFYRTPSSIPEVHDGTCNGLITEEPRGSHGFGYDPYFLSDDLGMTFGEASAEEKDRVSHRGNAFRSLLQSLAAHPL